jgi:hypothetical protein
MSRRNQLTVLSAGLAIALAACRPSTPITSVSALSYQVQSAGQRGTATSSATSLCAPSAQPEWRAVSAPAEISPNDPRRLLDMP